MRTFTKAHYRRDVSVLGLFLHKIKVIKPYTTKGRSYSFKANVWNPLTYVLILCVIVSTFIMSLVSSTYMQEVFDEMGEWFQSIPHDATLVDDFTDEV